MEVALDQVLTSIAAMFALAGTFSVVVERSLDVLFSWSWYEKKLGGKGLKVPISFFVSYVVAYVAGFDILVLLGAADVTFSGLLVTAGLLAGGSKGMAKTYGALRQLKESAKG